MNIPYGLLVIVCVLLVFLAGAEYGCVVERRKTVKKILTAQPAPAPIEIGNTLYIIRYYPLYN